MLLEQLFVGSKKSCNVSVMVEASCGTAINIYEDVATCRTPETHMCQGSVDPLHVVASHYKGYVGSNSHERVDGLGI